MYGCFELVGLFACKGNKTIYGSSIDSRGTALVTQARKQPQKHGNGKKPAANYEQAKVTNCAGVTVLCVL